jgi:hypothetical protein
MATSKQQNQINADAGSIQINSDYATSLTSSILLDKSNVIVQDKHGSFLQFMGGSAWLGAQAEFHQNVGQYYTLDIGGDSQYVYGGTRHTYLLKGETSQGGKNDSESQKAAQDLQTSLDKAQQAGLDAGKNATTKVPCPVCTSLVLSEQKTTAVTDRVINLHLPFISAAFKTIKKVFDSLFIGKQIPVPNSSLTKSGTCNHPNCDGSTIDVVDQQKATDAKINAIKNDKSIPENEQKLGSQADTALAGHNVLVNAGHYTTSKVPGYYEGPNPATHPTELEHDTAEMAQSLKGQPKTAMVPLPHDNPALGNLHLNASAKVDISSGSNGISLLTAGPTEIHSGTLNLISNTGELNLIGAGLTQIKGKTIHIDGKDNSGDGGVSISSDRTFTSGKLSVGADLSVKGAIHTDGTVYASSFVCEGMDMQTDAASSDQSIVHGATWNAPLPLFDPQATAQNAYSETVHTVTDGFSYATSILLQPAALYNIVKRKLNIVNINLSLDNQGKPTGICELSTTIEKHPIFIEGKTITGIPVFGQIIPGQMSYIYNAPHNHDNISGIHQHTHISPKAVYMPDRSTFLASRPASNIVPTPPVGAGAGSQPPTTGALPPITECGGLGGLLAGVASRNSAYGINGQTEADAFNGGNYVNVIPQYNADGSLKIAPNLSMVRNCD